MMLRAVTFDVYSALVDTVAGLTVALAGFLRRRGVRDDVDALSRTWRQKHLELLLVSNSLGREPASNRRALELAARYTLRHLEPPLSPHELAELVGAWERLPPFPDAIEVLEAVRRHGVTLAVLSNGDEDMLWALLAALPVPFDRVISTEGGRFKPHPEIYRKALDLTGNDPAPLVHVAGSATDAAGATAAGITTIWVNRTNDAVLDPRLLPAHVVRSLREAGDILRRLAEGS
jgi:2-haloacid dehalogenase